MVGCEGVGHCGVLIVSVNCGEGFSWGELRVILSVWLPFSMLYACILVLSLLLLFLCWCFRFVRSTGCCSELLVFAR